MPPADITLSPPDLTESQLAIHCDACQSALYSDSKQDIAFLLLDQLTIPLISCDDHLAWFTATCGVTTEETAELLQHRPAGGIRCPGCRLAPYNPPHPILAVQDGAIVVTACPEHQSVIVNRFHTGLQTQYHLTSELSTNTGSPL